MSCHYMAEILLNLLLNHNKQTNIISSTVVLVSGKGRGGGGGCHSSAYTFTITGICVSVIIISHTLYFSYEKRLY